MKKICSLAVITAILSLTASCSKNEPAGEDSLPEGKIVSFTLDVPASGAEDETKIALGTLADNKIPVTWTSGDAFKLFTCHEQDWYLENHETADLAVSDCGDFTTTDSGSSATFTGTIPSGAISETEGIAIFPSSAYTVNSAKVGKPADEYLTDITKYYIQVMTTIPDVQNGEGVPYISATARLKGGTMHPFDFGTALVKLNLPAGTGIDRIRLSKISEGKPLGGSEVKLYYYFTNAVSRSLAITSGSKYYYITVDKGGTELSGDIYFAVRNLDKNTKLTFEFIDTDGQKASKTRSGTLSSNLGAGSLIDFGTVNPNMIAMTSVAYTAGVKDNLVSSVTGEYFPWTSGKENGVYPISISDTFSEIGYTWYNEEHTYTCDGYDWTFGTNTSFTSDTRPSSNDGMYYYNASSRKQIRMDKKSYLKIPVVSDKTLSGVRCAVINGNATTAYLSAAADGSTPLSTLSLKKADGTVWFDVIGAVSGTQYYLTSNGSFQPSSLIFLYK